MRVPRSGTRLSIFVAPADCVFALGPTTSGTTVLCVSANSHPTVCNVALRPHPGPQLVSGAQCNRSPFDDLKLAERFSPARGVCSNGRRPASHSRKRSVHALCNIRRATGERSYCTILLNRRPIQSFTLAPVQASPSRLRQGRLGNVPVWCRMPAPAVTPRSSNGRFRGFDDLVVIRDGQSLPWHTAAVKFDS